MGRFFAGRPPMILGRATRWCIVGLTNSACRKWPKISCRSTSLQGRWSRLANPASNVKSFRRIENITMPGTTATPDIEIIVEDIGGGGGDDGDGGSDDGKRRRKWPASPKRDSTGIAICICGILMFFMGLVVPF